MVKTTIDKWKLKKWFELIAPAVFNEKAIGETFATDHRLLLGRNFEIALSDLTGDPKLQRMKLRFIITDVKGERALTQYLGHAITHDYERSLSRRRSSKIYANQTVETKDGQKVVVKSIIVTANKINRSLKNSLRKKMLDVELNFAKSEKFSDFVNSVLYGKLSMQIKKELHKIYPVKHAVIQKTEIVQSAPGAKS